MLISTHRDGRFIAGAIEKIGFQTISGSSRRGGGSALVRLIRTLRQGGAVGITPDGPRGPGMRAKAGAIKAAQLSGVPVLPCFRVFAPRAFPKVMGSFLLAAPLFTRCYCLGVTYSRPPRCG